MENVVVIGASPNPDRYSNKAVRSLLKRGYHVIPLGRKEGKIENLPIITGKPDIKNVHTVLMYISPTNQREYYDYIFQLQPKRIVFNPGTENYELGLKASKNNIECVFDCALIMLNTKTF
ncbi:MAG: CoA-binding protein [Bacteroidales bacterium]|nr:CoA-binding protein [Bacteroidales bacterium]